MSGRFAIIGVVWMLAGCAALLEGRQPSDDAGMDSTRTGATSATASPEAKPEIQPETGPEEQVAAAMPRGVLGRTVASLGDPTQGGAWLVTGLVSQTAPGRVTDLATGTQARVELRPSGGAPGSGGRLSLAGFQALGLSLTALPELEVSRE